MKRILVIGAGRSSGELIHYLMDHAREDDYTITVGDIDLKLAQQKTAGHERAEAVVFNALDPEQRYPYLASADLIISMLPARFHIEIVKSCIELQTPLITPSYLSDEIKSYHAEAIKRDVLILNELGLDPGIDHMSAMQMIQKVRDAGGQIEGFESFTGGLVAPESDDNPWHYKFTWNPRNVVLAGQGGTAKFIQEGKYKYIPYHKLFRRTEIIEIEGYGRFEGYANRDSLKYRDIYQLDHIKTLFRGTLRRVGFCRAWDLFVQLGATDDSYVMSGTEGMTYRAFFNSFLAYSKHDSVELKLMQYLGLQQDDEEIMEKLRFLGVFDDQQRIEARQATPAQVLEEILSKKWSLQPEDKDMSVMWHKLNYTLDGASREIQSSLVVLGENHEHTSMAKTVGLPLGIAARQVLAGNIPLRGVQLPTQPEIYQPVMRELESLGIAFHEKEIKPGAENEITGQR